MVKPSLGQAFSVLQAYRKFRKEQPQGLPGMPAVSIPDPGSVM